MDSTAKIKIVEARAREFTPDETREEMAERLWFQQILRIRLSNWMEEYNKED